jgi:carboxypeptidase C (cathepsin A)
MLQLIDTWLRANQRSESPLFIGAESYGGFRLATLLGHADQLKIAGLILISPSLDASASAPASGNDQPFIFSLPTMAVAAWEHHRASEAGRPIEGVYAEAARFAQSQYAVALQQGQALSSDERDRIAARMSAMTGIPAQSILQANLRLGTQEFLEALLKDQGLLVGRLDTRITAPEPAGPAPARPAAANDPALGLGASNVRKSAAIKQYMQHELNVQTTRDYISLTLEVNARWNWRDEVRTEKWSEPGFYVNPTINIAKVMLAQPGARLLLVGGYYDLAVPLLAPRYAVEHAGVPLDQVTMLAVPTGHSVFDAGAGSDRARQALREFLRNDAQSAH